MDTVCGGDRSVGAAPCNLGGSDTCLLQLRGDLLAQRFRQIDFRVIHYAAGAEEKSLNLHQRRISPIQVGQSVECLFDVNRSQNALGSSVEWAAIEQKPEGRKMRCGVL